MRSLSRSRLWWAVSVVWMPLLLASGCGRDSPNSSPTAPSPAAPLLLRVVDGWTGEPVSGAVVRTNTGANITTTPDTLVDVSTCASLSVDAGVRYLERRVFCRSKSLSSENAISLWPVATVLERQETQKALFRDGRLAPPSLQPYYLGDELLAIPGGRDAWLSAAAAINDLTAGQWHVVVRVGLDDLDTNGDAVVVTVASDHRCRFSSDPDPQSHYCYTSGPGYFVPYLLLEPGWAARRDLALKVLLESAKFGVGDLPGVTSHTNRTGDLSEVERRMLHMVGLRPVPISWPDWEF